MSIPLCDLKDLGVKLPHLECNSCYSAFSCGTSGLKCPGSASLFSLAVCFPLKPLAMGKRWQRGQGTVLSGRGWTFRLQVKCVSRQLHSDLGCWPPLQCLLELWTEAERTPCTTHCGGQVVPEGSGHTLMSRCWGAALSALGAWLSKYVKFPLTLGGRI